MQKALFLLIKVIKLGAVLGAEPLLLAIKRVI